MLDTIFAATPPAGLWHDAARAALIFVYGLALVRSAGRRIFARWSALDIVVSIIVGSNLSRAMTGNAPLWSTFASTTVLVALHWVLAHLAARSRLLSRVLEGKAVNIGENGALNRSTQRRWAVTMADVDQALHRVGLTSVDEARVIVLEPNGSMSVLK